MSVEQRSLRVAAGVIQCWCGHTSCAALLHLGNKFEKVHRRVPAWQQPTVPLTHLGLGHLLIQLASKNLHFDIFAILGVKMSVFEKKTKFIQNRHNHHRPNIHYNAALEKGNIQHNRGSYFPPLI